MTGFEAFEELRNLTSRDVSNESFTLVLLHTGDEKLAIDKRFIVSHFKGSYHYPPSEMESDKVFFHFSGGRYFVCTFLNSSGEHHGSRLVLSSQTCLIGDTWTGLGRMTWHLPPSITRGEMKKQGKTPFPKIAWGLKTPCDSSRAFTRKKAHLWRPLWLGACWRCECTSMPSGRMQCKKCFLRCIVLRLVSCTGEQSKCCVSGRYECWNCFGRKIAGSGKP